MTISSDPDVFKEPMAELARITGDQLWLERACIPWSQGRQLPRPLRWLDRWAGSSIELSTPEILWRGSGLKRAGLVAQFSAPRLSTHLAVGVETPFAHALIDVLLGYDRPLGDSRLQLTPVEWGLWSFLMLRALDALDSSFRGARGAVLGNPALLQFGDLVLDRVGPDPFDTEGLGSIVTLRFVARVAGTSGSIRIWLPEAIVRRWIEAGARPPRGLLDERSSELADGPGHRVSAWELSGLFIAQAGTLPLPHGLRRLRAGAVLPLLDRCLTGTPASPQGAVNLILDLAGGEGRFRIPARPAADAGGRLVRLTDKPVHEPAPQQSREGVRKEGNFMTGITTPATAPLDLPVTLVIELGRVNLTLQALADLKPGDVLELNRNSKSPVELTSNGRLVARGELILIDTDLGVRISNVFL